MPDPEENPQRPSHDCSKPETIGAELLKLSAAMCETSGNPQAFVQCDRGARPYQYYIVEQDLRTVLEEFGRNLGLRMTVSPAVQGRVKGNLPQSSAKGFLEALGRAYGLDWYYDGFTLNVSAISEGRNRQVELNDLSFEAAVAGVRQAGLFDERFQIRTGPSRSVAVVSGPPRFVEAVTEAISSLARRPPAPAPAAALTPPSRGVVRVFRGASAGETVTFPGPLPTGPVDQPVSSTRSREPVRG